MQKFQNFTRENMEDVLTLIDAKLAELKELGLDIKLGNMRFDSESFTSKIECRLKGGSDIYAATFEKSNFSIGYENAVGQAVVFSGKKYIFRGFKPRARQKHAILDLEGKGDLYRVEFSMVVDQLK